MASEDSDQFVPGLLVIHGLRDSSDLDETAWRPVPTTRNHLHTRREPLEVLLLRTLQRMLAKKRNDPLREIRPLRHDVLAQVLPVIVLTPVDNDPSAPEELTELLEAVEALHPLRHDKPVTHLIAGSVASPARAVLLPHETDREASFSVYKADHPTTKLDQPFLLIVRTRHVVTIVNVRPDGTMSSAGYSEFPAYGQMRTAPLPVRGAAIYLRTVIVTAAVYWGLDSKLRPKANLSS